ncbi:MAG: UPF0716 protein FxsA [Porticoccus sp.]|jgi:UPF0716 protein FxsA
MPLLVLFVVTPILEMLLLIEVGSKIGALNTVGLVLLTAMIGLALLRKQGVDTLLRANQKINSGEVPAQEMAEGLALAAGGALLLTPGFITDGIGFCLLLPFTRKLLVTTVFSRLVSKMTVSSQFHATSTQQYSQSIDSNIKGEIIEGEYTEHKDKP